MENLKKKKEKSKNDAFLENIAISWCSYGRSRQATEMEFSSLSFAAIQRITILLGEKAKAQ